MILRFSLILILAACSACTSSPYMLPESDGASSAPGAAFAADSMTFRKAMPDRRDQRAWEFYYKHCAMNGDKTYYSKSSYDCSGPY